MNVGDTVIMLGRPDFEGSTAVIEEILSSDVMRGAESVKLRHSNCSRRWPTLEGKTSSGWMFRQLQVVSVQPDETEAFFV